MSAAYSRQDREAVTQDKAQVTLSRRGKFITLKMHAEKGCVNSQPGGAIENRFLSELPSRGETNNSTVFT